MQLEDLSDTLILQKIYNYASPILVGMESISIKKKEIGEDNDDIRQEFKWMYVLETIGILLAHCVINDNQQTTLLTNLANNIRNL